MILYKTCVDLYLSLESCLSDLTAQQYNRYEMFRGQQDRRGMKVMHMKAAGDVEMEADCCGYIDILQK